MTEPQEPTCHRCGRSVTEHGIYHDEPPHYAGREGLFDFETQGLYCPTSPQPVGDPGDNRDNEPCRAKRWSATPVFDGPHEPHLFTYGPNGMYTGSCRGR